MSLNVFHGTQNHIECNNVVNRIIGCFFDDIHNENVCGGAISLSKLDSYFYCYYSSFNKSSAKSSGGIHITKSYCTDCSRASSSVDSPSPAPSSHCTSLLRPRLPRSDICSSLPSHPLPTHAVRQQSEFACRMKTLIAPLRSTLPAVLTISDIPSNGGLL